MADDRAQGSEQRPTHHRQGSAQSDVSEADNFFETPSGGEDGAQRKDDTLPAQAMPAGAEPRVESPAEPAAAAPGAVDDNATLAALAADADLAPGERDPNADNTPSFVLVAALRSQITDLTSQVTSLNSKLVSSYTRIGDLDDDLHDRADEVTHLKLRVAELERSKETWEREIAVGGWVERDHVQTEMRGLMTKVLEETKERETAVEAHGKLETEIENLTSSLFTEANRMVAVERFARSRAEEKMRALEESGAVMTGMFDEVQATLRETVEKLEARERDVDELQQRVADASPDVVTATAAAPAVGTDRDAQLALFSDGDRLTDIKALSHRLSPPGTPSRGVRAPRHTPRLITSVVPYTEFIAFVTYLRQLRVTVLSRPQEHAQYPHHPYANSSSITTRGFGAAAQTSSPATPTIPLPPAVLLAAHLPLSAHLSQPFVKRCVEEDSDPSLRLDLAPGLGFLSRRNVSTAIVDGTLLIEPTYSGSTLPSSTCALCGTGLERWWAGGEIIPTNTTNAKVNQTMRKVLGSGGWSIPSFAGGTRVKDVPVPAPSLPATPPATDAAGGESPFTFPALPHQQIHIFRLTDTSTTRYAICPTYCLPRLRAVCEFWTYVRAIERGLLLEDGFHFVGGKGVNGALVESRSGSTVSLHGKSRSSLSGLKSVENLVAQSSNAAVGLAPLDRQGGEMPVAVVIDDSGLAVEDDVGAQAGDIATSTEVVTVVEPANDTPTPQAEADAPKDEDDLKVPSSPMMSAPSSPVLGQGSGSTSSLNKPPVPKRDARRPATPTPGTPGEPNATTPAAHATPPKLPPRSPSHPVAAAKASELGDAMDIVGGATGWEDRCWTEVVRLKESMFWTRMAREPEEL